MLEAMNMRKLLCGFFILSCFAGALIGQTAQKPLQALPYTPSLDTRVEKRNPYNLDHKMQRAEFQKLMPDFDWTTYLSAIGDGHSLSRRVPHQRRRCEHAGIWQSIQLQAGTGDGAREGLPSLVAQKKSFNNEIHEIKFRVFRG
jgi:hypothetical protein